MHDTIPGLIGNKMSTRSIDIKPCRREDIVLNKIIIETSSGFEDKFLLFLKQFVYEKYKLPDEIDKKTTLLRVGQPRIVERKMYVDYDNTWRSSGEKVFISLQSPKGNRYEAKSYIEVNNFLIDPGVALTFKIEFRLDMPTQDKKKKETAFFTLAWGYYLQDFNSNGEVVQGVFDCELKMGPGITPDGSPLWTPENNGNEKFKLVLSADIILKGKFYPNSIDLTVRNKPPSLTVSRSRFLEKKEIMFKAEEILGAQALPERVKMEDKSLVDRKTLEENRRKEEKIKNLEDQLKNIKTQYYDWKTSDALAERDYDTKDIRREKHENQKILLDKMERKLENMKNDYAKYIENLKEQDKLEMKKGISNSPENREPPRGAYPHQLPYASNYLADPSMHHPSFYPPDDRSRLIGQSKYIDEDLKVLPPPPHIQLELPATFDLSRDDEIAFVKLGIKD
jgi:hypothetical protein